MMAAALILGSAALWSGLVAAWTHDERIAVISALGLVMAAGLGALGAYLAARRGIGGIVRAVDTGNEKKAGAYIHDTAETVELVQVQGHTAARRQDEMHTAVLEIRERLVELHEEVHAARGEARRAMVDHMAEIAPLRARIAEHLENEGGRS